MSRALTALLCLALFASPLHAQKLIGITHQPGLVLGIDLDAGTWRMLGMVNSWNTNSLTKAPDGTLYSIGRIDPYPAPLKLLRVDPALPTPDVVAEVAVTDVRGVAMNADDTLYALEYDGFTGTTTLVRMHVPSGVHTVLGPTGQPSIQSLEFGPDGELYGMSGIVGLVRLDTDSGAAADLFTGDDAQGGTSQSLFWDADGQMYASNHDIVEVGPDGVFGASVFQSPFALRGVVVVDELPTSTPYRVELFGATLGNSNVYVFGAEESARQTLLVNRGLGSLPLPGCPGVELALPDPMILAQQVAWSGDYTLFTQPFGGMTNLDIFMQAAEGATCTVSNVVDLDD